VAIIHSCSGGSSHSSHRRELRGLILLLMNIDDHVEMIRGEVVEGDGEES
jgi:hypothetical protein